MAGKLVQVATNTITSAVSSIQLTGIDDDSVYMVAFNNASPTTNEVDLHARVLESGTPNTTSNYDRAVIGFRANASFLDIGSANASSMDMGNNMGTGTSETINGIIYIYNANNSSEFTFLTLEQTEVDHSQLHVGFAGGYVFTSESAVNGIELFFDSGSTTATGTFTLYKVV